jgi:serine/threonine-protein kinase
MNEDPNIGRVLSGKYELTRLVGTGGMGAVYEAHHRLIARRLAVKLLHTEYASDESVVKRFRREATNTTAVGHHNIVEITDMGVTDDGELFIVMEFLEGKDLASILADEGNVSIGWACTIMSQVLSALQATHAAGIVHRDLKPANIFITQHPQQGPTVKLVDFGISKVRATEEGMTKGLTRTGELLGTPQYMSTEQARGETGITAATDIWAAGVILYEMLTGSLPFPGDGYMEILLRILSDETPDPRALREQLTPELAAAITKAMEKNPDTRHPSAADFLAAIRPYADQTAAAATTDVAATPAQPAANEGSPSQVQRMGTTPLALAHELPPTEHRKRSLVPWFVGIGCALAVGAVLSWFALAGGSDHDRPPAATVPLTPAAPAEPLPPEPAAAPAEPEPVAKVKIELEVTPAEARIAIDGKEIGQGSGAYEVESQKGIHRLRVVADGHDPVERPIMLADDLELKISLREQRKTKAGSKPTGKGKTGGAKAPQAEPEPEKPAKPEKDKKGGVDRKIDEDIPW